MLTGRSPFGGSADLNGILKQVLTEPTPPPTSRNPKLPRAFDHIVAKALAKDPAERYQDADEMARDLRRYDILDLTTTAPAPLPALEHPTTQQKPAPAPDIPEAPLVPTRRWPRSRGGSARWCGVPPHPASSLSRLRPRSRRATAARARRTRPSWRPAATSPRQRRPLPCRSQPHPRPRSLPGDGHGRAIAESPPVAEPVRAPAVPALAPSSAPTEPKVAEAAPAPLPAAPKPTGRVVLAVSPWGEIYVDGKKRGVSPPVKELRLPPGKHAIEIRNGAFPPHSETVDVNPDEAVRITHAF